MFIQYAPSPTTKMANIACSVCSASASDQCSACKNAFYCGTQCQTKAWPMHAASCAGSAGALPPMHIVHADKSITVNTGGTSLQQTHRIDTSVFTWNMSGRDARRTVDEWDASDAGGAWLAATDPANLRLVVVMLQEVHGKGQFGDFIAGKFKEHGYRALHVKNTSIARLFGEHFEQHMHIFIPPVLSRNFHASNKLSACFGDAKMCVKGTVAQFVQLRFAGGRYANLLFMCSHLPFKGAGKKGAQARVAAYRATINSVLTPAFARLSVQNATRENTTVVWGGDMNFRNALKDPNSGADTRWRKGSDPWDSGLRPYVTDELTRARFHPDTPIFPPNAWHEFGQPADLVAGDYVPEWPPTCKMLQTKNANQTAHRLAIAREAGMPNAYDPDRLPSHCDRMFYTESADGPRVTKEEVTKNVSAALDSDHDVLHVNFVLRLM